MHHGDYLNRRDDQALCGAAFEKPTQLDPTTCPTAVCPDCEAKLAEYHVKWWRERAEAATAELDELRTKYDALAESVENQRREVDGLQRPAPAKAGLSSENPHGRDQTTPTPILDQARKELVDLCRLFDEAVPYWRVKKRIDAFNDKLESEERVLLAHEIGAEGSLIRWCTKEIEGLGRQVTNSPVHGDAEDMMDAWTHDLYPTPKKTKWRLGRSRTHDGG